jgi:hypothetical protein
LNSSLSNDGPEVEEVMVVEPLHGSPICRLYLRR